MKLKVYAYSGCGTCKKALKWLDAQGVDYTVAPIRETPPSAAELKRLLKANGGELRKLFNTAGGDYRAMNMKEKLPGLSEAEAIALLTQHGNLCKRPMALGAGVALVGFNEAQWRDALAGR